MPDATPAAALLFLREEELSHSIDLLYFAQRDFAGAADGVLAESGLDRVRHQILHFVARHPRIAVSELASMLGLTKQSLGRAVDRLIADGLLVERVGPSDRRQRVFQLTEAGAALERRAADRFRARIARAYREAGAQAVEGFRRVLLGLVDDADRRKQLERNAAPRR
jgi:DNA-binding MarR family transcriptional regulator